MPFSIVPSADVLASIGDPRNRPRAAFRVLMTHESRTAYEHHIPPVADLRYSVTFRTLR